MPSEKQPIETAPKNGMAVWIGHDEVGGFLMAWNPTATNPFFAPGQVGMWETIDGKMTWGNIGDGAPEWWAVVQ